MSPIRISRRQFVAAGVRACAAATVLPAARSVDFLTSGAPAILQSDASRPALAQGVAAGDVTNGRAVIRSRTARPSRPIVEYSTREKFETVLRRVGPAALEPSYSTSRVALTDLPPDQRIFYRVQFQ